MALTPEQQQQLEFNQAQAAINQTNENKGRRLEMIRLAKEILVENDRNKPVDSRGFTADDVVTEANKLVAFVNQ